MKIDVNAENGSLNEIQLDVLKWYASGKTGVSSKTIAAAMAEVDSSACDIPHDPSDFIRCLNMLKACPSIKNLSKVKDKFPFYAPIIDNWNEMVDLLEQDRKEHKDKAPLLYKYMKMRNIECTFLKGRILDGIMYIDVDKFEKKYGVKVTLENLHNCIERAKYENNYMKT